MIFTAADRASLELAHEKLDAIQSHIAGCQRESRASMIGLFTEIEAVAERVDAIKQDAERFHGLELERFNTQQENTFGTQELNAETFSRVTGALERTVTGMVAGLKAEMLNQFAMLAPKPLSETVEQKVTPARTVEALVAMTQQLGAIEHQQRETRAAITLLVQEEGKLTRLMMGILNDGRARKRKGKRK